MPDTHPSQVQPGGLNHIGLIAGQGEFPFLIARAAQSHGIKVTTFAIQGFASPELASCSDTLLWVELGQVGKTIDLMHEHDVHALTMAGRVPHTSVLQYRHFDLRALKMLARTINKKADSLLRVVADELESEGIQVLDSSLFLKQLMPPPGLLTLNRPLAENEHEDVEFGYPIAKVVAGQDIGQTIVVKDKMVVAVEGAEGTDECIRRAAALGGPGCVVVKVSKPQQDLRFDIPVIGKKTIEVMHEAQAAALAISAHESLIFGSEEVLRLAEQFNIAIVAR